MSHLNFFDSVRVTITGNFDETNPGVHIFVEGRCTSKTVVGFNLNLIPQLRRGR